MRRSFILAAVSLAAAPPAAAQSLFDGNWKEDLAAAKLDPRPDTFALSHGIYACTSCVPAYAVPADGRYHSIPGHSYADETSITVIDARTLLQRYRKGGAVTAEDTSTVSSDGDSMTVAWKDYTAPTGQLVTGSATETRLKPAPAGAHATSGSWRNTGAQTISDAGLRFTLATHGDLFHYADPTGVTYEGRFGGAYAPIVGDPAHTMTKIERISANELRETQMRDGTVVMTMDLTVSADGRTLTSVMHDTVRNTTNMLVSAKE